MSLSVSQKTRQADHALGLSILEGTREDLKVVAKEVSQDIENIWTKAKTSLSKSFIKDLILKGDQEFFLNVPLSKGCIETCCKIARILQKIPFLHFLESIHEAKLVEASYEKYIVSQMAKEKSYFSFVPSIQSNATALQSGASLSLSWEPVSLETNLNEVDLQFKSLIDSTPQTKPSFENFEHMKEVFQQIKSVISDGVSREISSKFSVTHMLWTSFLLEKHFQISSVECLLKPIGEFFHLNPERLSPKAFELISSMMESDLSNEELSTCEELFAEPFFKQLIEEEKNLLWNFHAGVSVACKIGDEEKVYIFDLLLDEPLEITTWENTFAGRLIPRPSCKTIVLQDVCTDAFETNHLYALENQWKLSKNIQLQTLKLISASLKSAQDGVSEKVVHLVTPFVE